MFAPPSAEWAEHLVRDAYWNTVDTIIEKERQAREQASIWGQSFDGLNLVSAFAGHTHIDSKGNLSIYRFPLKQILDGITQRGWQYRVVGYKIFLGAEPGQEPQASERRTQPRSYRGTIVAESADQDMDMNKFLVPAIVVLALVLVLR